MDLEEIEGEEEIEEEEEEEEPEEIDEFSEEEEEEDIDEEETSEESPASSPEWSVTEVQESPETIVEVSDEEEDEDEDEGGSFEDIEFQSSSESESPTSVMKVTNWFKLSPNIYSRSVYMYLNSHTKRASIACTLITRCFLLTILSISIACVNLCWKTLVVQFVWNLLVILTSTRLDS